MWAARCGEDIDYQVVNSCQRSDIGHWPHVLLGGRHCTHRARHTFSICSSRGRWVRKCVPLDDGVDGNNGLAFRCNRANFQLLGAGYQHHIDNGSGWKSKEGEQKV